jgi:hypothetical protein
VRDTFENKNIVENKKLEKKIIGDKLGGFLCMIKRFPVILNLRWTNIFLIR